jgi:hypothetical protein
VSWDDAYKELEQQFGREPQADEVQMRMLELAQGKVELLQND